MSCRWQLSDTGIHAAHVRDHDLQHATDSVILEFARQHAFVLASEDTDFGELLARQCTVAPSFVLLRTYEPMTPDDQAAVLVANLPRLYDDLGQGAIAPDFVNLGTTGQTPGALSPS